MTNNKIECFMNICKEEKTLIITHINSLVCDKSITKLDINVNWKNWLSVYTDYIYSLDLNQTYHNKIFIFDEMAASDVRYRYDKRSGKYLGIFFPLWFFYIKSIKYTLQTINNIYVMHDNTNVNIEGNEKYKVFINFIN